MALIEIDLQTLGNPADYSEAQIRLAFRWAVALKARLFVLCEEPW